jgi:RNA polymerase sigma-70 factor (ECF subfamily)
MKDDYLLVEECKRNNTVAFEQLYHKYAPRMKGVAYRYCNDLAEDIVQEAFVKVFNKINEFENTGQFEAWLRRIVVNTAINQFHSSKKETERMNDFLQSPDNSNSSYGEEEEEEEEYSMEDMMYAINKLPAGYKMVFNLYAIDDYSHKEIAEALKISEGTSKSQLSKARIFLRKELQGIKQLTK